MKNELYAQLDLTKAIIVKSDDLKPLSDTEICRHLDSFTVVPDNCLIIINDHYRSTPTNRIIKLLRKTGKIISPVTFIIATGSHKPPTLEVASKLCSAISRDTILCHDINSVKNYLNCGITSRGTEVFVNPIINKFETIITIGSVEPHYFAGFTGGAKSIVPGIASLETIVNNHRWAMTPDSALMKTTGNPVFEDIWESANLVVPLNSIDSIQIVNHGNDIYDASVGKLPEAFECARQKSMEIYGKNLKEKVDVVISCVSSPLDENLYQAQKAIENCKNIIKEGGSLLLVAKCQEGVGSKNFFDRLNDLGSAENIMNTLNFENYKFGDHKAYKFAETTKTITIYYYGDLDTETASKAYMNKITLEELKENYNKWITTAKTVVLDDAGGINAFYIE